MMLEIRRRIIRDIDNGMTAFMATKKYDLTMQTVNCVILFREMDDETFMSIND